MFIEPNRPCQFIFRQKPKLLYGAALSLLTLLSFKALAKELEFWEQWPGSHELIAQDHAAPASLPLPVETPPALSEPPLYARARMFVRRFELSGNTVFSDNQLAAVTRPYTDRTITAEELQEVRRRLALYYIERGYISSGAMIPDQQAKDGVIKIHIIEGRLSDVEIKGNAHLRPEYFQDRLRPEEEAPLNVRELQKRLQLLQQNPLIEQLRAELVPGVQPGEGVLHLEVREARSREVGLTLADNNPPSVGATRVHIYGLDRNLTGAGDSLELSYGHSLESSTADWRMSYARPLNAHDTKLHMWAGQSETSVIEERFSTLDITSKLQSYGISLTHPFYLTPQQTLSLGVHLERRHSESFLLGIPFSFAPGEEDGQATVTSVRFVQEWLDRRPDQVIAARSNFTFGLDAFGATVHGFEPDGRFVAWLGQFQWTRRFGERDYQIVFKSNLQLADDPLLPIEKCALGGMDTVRGYPENTLVRDECFMASLEFRVPIHELPLAGVSRGPNEGQVQLAAFADYGHAKNKSTFDLEPNSIYSAGLGVRWDPSPKIHAALYWGYPFQEVTVGDKGWLSSRVNISVQAAY